MCSSRPQMQDREEQCKRQSANNRSSPFLWWEGEEYGQWEEAEWRAMENAWGIRTWTLTSALRGSCCFCCRGLLCFWAADTVSLTFISSQAGEAQDFPVPTFSFSCCLGTAMTPEPGALTPLWQQPRTNIPAWPHTGRVQSFSVPTEFTVLWLACKASKPKILSSNLGLESIEMYKQCNYLKMDFQ